MLQKDIAWTIKNVDYIIRNVPYEVFDADGVEFIDLGVAIKLEAIKDLMMDSKIPCDVDYTTFDGIEF